MRRSAVAIGGGIVAVAAVPAAAVVLALTTLSSLEGVGLVSSGSQLASVSEVAGIPSEYLADLEQAGARFDVPWAVLAAIYYEECDFGQSALEGCNPSGSENEAGAQGPGQFLPGTWRRGLAPHQLILPGPPTSSDADGYATDGDGDGIADPWDPADAIASTARLLAANGASSGDLAGAVFAYNHDPSYVDAVLARAATYDMAARDGPGSGGALTDATGSGSPQAAESAIATVVSFARGQLGLPYRWGGSGPAAWDCSGLVQAAFASVGVAFTHDAAAQYAATSSQAVPTTSELQPGDLVFFGDSLAGIEHVGIVVGPGQMIDAPHTGAFVRTEPYRWSDLIAATRPL